MKTIQESKGSVFFKVAVVLFLIGTAAIAVVKVSNEKQMTKEYARQAEAQEQILNEARIAQEIKSQEFGAKLECTVTREAKWINEPTCTQFFRWGQELPCDEGKKGRPKISISCSEKAE